MYLIRHIDNNDENHISIFVVHSIKNNLIMVFLKVYIFVTLIQAPSTRYLVESVKFSTLKTQGILFGKKLNETSQSSS